MDRNEELTEYAELRIRLTDAVQTAVDHVFDSMSLDAAYWEYRFTFRRLSLSFDPLGDEETLIDSHDSYCGFCGKRTYAYDTDLGPICANCNALQKQPTKEC